METEQRVIAFLNQISLAAHADKFHNTLSGGHQQRAALAHVPGVQPWFLLFEEPLSNIDAKLNKYLKIFVN